MSQVPSNSDISHFSDCVYYDSELRRLSKLFDEQYKIFKNIKKRAERRQTIQISKSLFDYVEKSRTRFTCPQTFYDFKYDDYRVCIYFYSGKYSILCIGFDFRDGNFRSLDWFGKGKLYGEFKNLSDSLALYCNAVDYLLNRVLRYKELPLSDDVPF